MLNLSDLNNPSGMYSDLITEFIDKGHSVYPVAAGSNLTTSLLSNENGINVIRVKTFPLFNVNIVRKGLANLLLPLQYKRAIKKYLKNIDPELIVMPTPPIILIGVVRY